MTHARRQQYRHLVLSVGYGLAAAGIVWAAIAVAAAAGTTPIVSMLLLCAAGLSAVALRSKRLAKRWRVGADLEQPVRSALDELGPLGWTVRHGVRWPGRGDVDHIVRSPDGPGFAIETKTLNFSSEHLRRTEAWARWVARRRRRYPLGVVPVVCVVRARRIESRYDDVVVVSLDRVLSVLQRLGANTGRAAGATRPLVAEP